MQISSAKVQLRMICEVDFLLVLPHALAASLV